MKTLSNSSKSMPYLCLTAVATRKGQITLPAPIRKYLGLKAGDKILFTTTK